MQAYTAAAEGSIHRADLLIGVLNKGLPPNDANLKIVRQRLATVRAPEEKGLLMRVLASLYIPRARGQWNLLIEGDIKKVIESADRRLAAQAVMHYSRLAYPQDRYAVLQRAHRTKLIDDDAYYGELANGLRFSSPVQRMQMLSELASARNRYANDILAGTFLHEQTLEQLSLQAQAALFAILASQEPAFPLELDSFGGVAMFGYLDWLQAVTLLESRRGGVPRADLVIARLSDPRADPRKILAFFGSPEAERVVRDSGNTERLRVLLLRAQDYANTLPGNAMLAQAARTFASRMSEAGRAQVAGLIADCASR